MLYTCVNCVEACAESLVKVPAGLPCHAWTNCSARMESCIVFLFIELICSAIQAITVAEKLCYLGGTVLVARPYRSGFTMSSSAKYIEWTGELFACAKDAHGVPRVVPVLIDPGENAVVYDRDVGEYAYWCIVYGALLRVLEPFMGTREEVEHLVFDLREPQQPLQARMLLATMPRIPLRVPSPLKELRGPGDPAGTERSPGVDRPAGVDLRALAQVWPGG